MENENLFKEIQAYPELNSPLNFFPIINHDLEKYNSKYRNAEKSKIFSSVLFGFEKNSNDSSLLSGELIWKDNLKSNGKKLSKKLYMLEIDVTFVGKKMNLLIKWILFDFVTPHLIFK